MAQRRLAQLERQGRRRFRDSPAEPRGGGAVEVRSNDYLGLGASVVSRETTERLQGVALGAGASRLVGGGGAVHHELERQLAGWLGLETALLFSSAYAAGSGSLAALATEEDLILSDERNHASLIDGCRLSRARVEVAPHGDLDWLESRVCSARPASGVAWVVVESYYSMDADVPDLRRLHALCRRLGAGLVVDEAHALGVFGDEGRGLCWESGVSPDVLIGGFGKAFGLHGGFVATSAPLADWLWNRARPFVFSTAPSPVLATLALGQLRRVRSAARWASALRRNELALAEALARAGLLAPDSPRRGPIFPLIVGSEGAAVAAAASLLRRGFVAQPIRPPSVVPGASRLRVTVTSEMSPETVANLGAALSEVLGEHSRSAREQLALGVPDGAPPPPASSERPGEGSTVEERVRPGPLRLVLLGTGTGVGKTHVAEALLRLEAGRGVAAMGLKPVETGWDPLRAEAADAARLERASFHVKHPARHPLFALRDPLAPSLAARREGETIRIGEVARWVRAASREEPGSWTQVVETAGGVFSPLSDLETNFELALALEPAFWVLVVPDRLGALTEAESTLRAMAASGRMPDWLIFNAPAVPDASTGTNREELSRRHPQLRMSEVGRAGEAQELAPVLDAVRAGG